MYITAKCLKKRFAKKTNIFKAGYDPHKDLCNYLINTSPLVLPRKRLPTDILSLMACHIFFKLFY